MRLTFTIKQTEDFIFIVLFIADKLDQMVCTILEIIWEQ